MVTHTHTSAKNNHMLAHSTARPQRGKDLFTVIFFPSINTHLKGARDEGGEMSEFKEQRDRAT